MLERTEPTASSSITIVILNYRTPSLTINCLRSLVGEVRSMPNTQVVVSDNASGDGSVEQIQAEIDAEGWKNWVSVMPLARNGGYAFGNNAVIRQALCSDRPPAYFLLLNPDTIVLPGAIQALVNFMNEHPNVGIAGSRLEDPDGTPQCSAFRFHTIWSELDAGLQLGIVSKLLSRQIVAPPVPETVCQTDWVAGASAIVRRAVFEQAGLLDEGYFMYYEDGDFCRQAQKAGWSCWYVPQSRVIHLVGQSSGVTDTKRPLKRRPQYWFNSRRRFFIKNYGLPYAILADFARVLGLIFWKIRKFVQRKTEVNPPSFLSDLIRNSLTLRKPASTQI
jgi:N-acetylglucosaminyl-diphospho-decaprenol L-rhamnosyltransferase